MASQRSLSIDALRLAAAFGVVLIHMAPSTEAASAFTQLFQLFAVPFFFLISLYFFINRVSPLSSFSLSDLHMDRILVPCLAWTAVYTAMRLLKFHLLGKHLSIDVIGVVFFGGGAVQLYFLPLLLLFQAQSLAVLLMFRTSKLRMIGVCVALGAVLYGYAGSEGNYFGFHDALRTGLTYVAMAFLLCWVQARAIGQRINAVIGWLVVALIFPTVYLGYPLYALGIMQGSVIGYGVAAFALNSRFQTTTPSLRMLLTCSYGIYLAHFGFLESFEFVAVKCSWALAPYSVIAKIFMGGLVCLCCVLLIAVARMHWLSAYLFLGEGARRTIRPAG